MINKFFIFCFYIIAIYSILNSGNSIAGEVILGDLNLIAKGEKWEFLNNENKVIANQNVKATSPEFTLFCDKLIAYYVSQSDSPIKSDKQIQQVKLAHAINNVIIEFNNGYTSMSDRADYYKDKRKIILTGNARVISDKNQIDGCIITYYLDSHSYSIESCPDKQTNGKIIE